MSSRLSSTRRAFTLVEMLVVLGIIGILVGLLLPAIMAAVSRARQAQIALEIKQLDAAFQSYKMAKGEYPPSFGERNTSGTLIYNITTSGQPNRYNSVVEQHLQRAFPKLRDNPSSTTDAKDAFYSHSSNRDAMHIDQGEALVLWLSGTSTAPANPFEGFTTGTLTIPRNTYFEFDQRRLIDNDGDGFPTYQARHCRETDYVYMENRSYANYMRQNCQARVAISPSATLDILPYAQNATTGVNPQGFQIICAGFDGDFGGLTTVAMGFYTPKMYPGGGNYNAGDKDNLTNFSEGRTLGDSRPQ